MILKVSGGSVPGTDHTKPGKPGWVNNHDSFGWSQLSNDCLVAVVCDGCGSGAHSEVGAKLATQISLDLLSDATNRYMIETALKESSQTINLERVKTLLTSQIGVLAHSMGRSFSMIINDYFLFTMVGCIVTPVKTFLFSVGDGVFVLNGEVVRLGPFPDNAPPYISYNLLGRKVDIDVNRTIATSDLQSLIIGSDGAVDLIEAENKLIPRSEEKVGNILQFVSDDLYFKNKDAVRRRLSLVNKEAPEVVNGVARMTQGLLPDDTTLIAVRHDKEI